MERGNEALRSSWSALSKMSARSRRNFTVRATACFVCSTNDILLGDLPCLAKTGFVVWVKVALVRRKMRVTLFNSKLLLSDLFLINCGNSIN